MVLVAASNVECHHTLKEYLRDWVVTEQRISTDVEQLARGRTWQALVHRDMYDRGVEAQEYLEPFLSPAEYRTGV